MDHQIADYKCGMCNKKCQNQQELGLYLTVTHKCEICDKVFTHYGTKQLHLKKVHSQNSKKSKKKDAPKEHYCSTCNKTFKKADYLQIHINSVHLEEKTMSVIFVRKVLHKK